jgi:hypothetical protein
MDDMRRTAQEAERLGTQQAVGIGDESDTRRVYLAPDHRRGCWVSHQFASGLLAQGVN